MQEPESLQNLELQQVKKTPQKSVGGHLAYMFQEATIDRLTKSYTISSMKKSRNAPEFMAFFNERDHMGRLILV